MGGSNEDDNETPWESASNDRAFREQTETSSRDGRAPQTTGEPSSPAVTSVRWDVEEDNSNNNNNNDVSFLTSDTVPDAFGQPTNAPERRGVGPSSCWMYCRSNCSLSYFLHVWDVVMTTLWMLVVGYHLIYNKDHEKKRSTPMILLLVMSTAVAFLNALRGILWIWVSLPSLSTICCCGCFFEEDVNGNQGIGKVSKFATTLTLWLAIVYGSISAVAWFGPTSWLPWCSGFGPWCSRIVHAQKVMPIALTVASAIELLRWIFLQGKMSSVAAAERTRSPDYYNDDFATSPSETSRHRPWWSNRHGRNHGNDDGLRDPLLEGGTSTNRQPSWAVTSWIPFGSPRRVNNISNDNNNNTSGVISGDEEDVESVLDSLGEDWASRAESDPYWWTR